MGGYGSTIRNESPLNKESVMFSSKEEKVILGLCVVLSIFLSWGRGGKEVQRPEDKTLYQEREALLKKRMEEAEADASAWKTKSKDLETNFQRKIDTEVERMVGPREKTLEKGEALLKDGLASLRKDKDTLKPAQDKLEKDLAEFKTAKDAFEREKTEFDKLRKVLEKKARIADMTVELVKIEEDLKLIAKERAKNPQDILDRRREATRQVFRGEDIKKELRDLAVNFLPSQSASRR